MYRAPQPWPGLVVIDSPERQAEWSRGWCAAILLYNPCGVKWKWDTFHRHRLVCLAERHTDLKERPERSHHSENVISFFWYIFYIFSFVWSRMFWDLLCSYSEPRPPRTVCIVSLYYLVIIKACKAKAYKLLQTKHKVNSGQLLPFRGASRKEPSGNFLQMWSHDRPVTT